MIDKEQIEYKLHAIRESAQARGYTCTLNARNIRKLLEEQYCQYTGVEFDESNKRSFERIDNSLGYIPGNVIPVTILANKLKSDHTCDELHRRIKEAPNRFKTKRKNVEHRINLQQIKINKRKKQIKELEALLVKDLDVLEKMNVEQEGVLRTEQYEAANLEIIGKILSSYETAPTAAQKYLTLPQRITNLVKSLITRLTSE